MLSRGWRLGSSGLGGTVYMAGWRLFIYGIPLLLIAVVQLRSALLQCTIY